MEEEKKYPWWKKILIGLEIMICLFLVFVLVTVVTSAVIWLSIYLCYGECTVDHLELWSGYIRLAYGAFLVVGLSVYLRYINNKYKIM
jgi:uncharacterized BrkB/YihY/UPF0761 family membrane protein